MKKNTEVLFFWLLLISVYFVGFYFRADGLSDRPLEYDEIWTLEHYVEKGDILTVIKDVSTPNNHPLNSIFCRASIRIFGYGKTALRLPAFLAGILLTLTVPLTAWLLFRNRYIVLLSATFCLFNGALAHYSQTARGYEIQSFFISLFVLLALSWGKTRKPVFKALISLELVLSGVMALLTLPTTILFLPIIVMVHLCYIFFGTQNIHPISKFLTGIQKTIRKNFILLFAYGIFLAFMAAWCVLIYPQLKAAQGSLNLKLTPLEPLYIFNVFNKTSGTPLFIAGLFIFIRKKHIKYGLAYLLIIFFPFCHILVSQAAPPRIYTPLLPFIAIAASVGTISLLSLLLKNKCNIRRKRLFLTLFTMLIITLSFFNFRDDFEKWTPINWITIAKTLNKIFPAGVYFSYPAAAGLCLATNYEETILENLSRTPKKENFFIQVQADNSLKGMDLITKSEKMLKIRGKKPALKIKTGKISCMVYQLKKLTSNKTTSNIIIASMPLQKKHFIEQNASSLIKENITAGWMILNPWLRYSFTDPETGFEYNALVLVVDKKYVSIPKLLNIAKTANGGVKFFCLDGIDTKDIKIVKPKR